MKVYFLTPKTLPYSQAGLPVPVSGLSASLLPTAATRLSAPSTTSQATTVGEGCSVLQLICSVTPVISVEASTSEGIWSSLGAISAYNPRIDLLAPGSGVADGVGVMAGAAASESSSSGVVRLNEPRALKRRKSRRVSMFASFERLRGNRAVCGPY